MDAPTRVSVDRRGPYLVLAAVGLGLVLLLVLVAAGVFGDSRRVDEDAWRAAVEEQSGPVADWEAHRDVWLEEICGEDDDAFAWIVATAVGEGAPVGDLRTNVEHACPERLDVLDRVGPAVTDVLEACRTRPRQQGADQRSLADGLGC